MPTESSVKDRLNLLQAKFKQHLPGRIKDIEALWNDFCRNKATGSTLPDLHRMAHSLAGTGGTFGAVAVGTMARELEETLKTALNESDNKSSVSDEWQQRIQQAITQLKHAADQWNPSPIDYVQPGDAKDERAGNLVYLAEDDDLLAEDLTGKLERADYVVRHFSDLNSFEAAFEQEVPAVIIMDIVFSEGDIAGAEIITRIKSKQTTCPPVIFISVRDDIEVRLATARAGASRYFCKPLNTNKLIQTLDGLTAKKTTKPYRILLIDDDETLLEYYATVLRDARLEVMALRNPLECLNALAEFKPDIVVTDVYMPECSGTELAQVIRQDDAWAIMPIMFLSTEASLNRQLDALNLGGDDFLVKPIEAGHLVAAVKARAKRARWTSRLNKDLQDALRESQYQLTTMDQHDIVSSTDVSGNILSVNDRFCAISGYSREELIGKNHRLLQSSYHAKSFYEDLWKTISAGKIWRGVICNRKKNGDEYWVESTIVPFLDDKGKPYKYVSARTDITASRASHERLERGQLYAGIGTWDWGIRNDKIYWSDKVKKLYGYTSELKGATYDHFINIVHPDDKQAVNDAVEACLEHGVKYDIEHRVIWPDGSVHWMLERGDVLRSEEGEPLHFLGVVQDITERMEAQARQQETEQRLVFAIEGAGDGVGDWDMSTNNFEMSKFYTDMLGYEEGELPPHIDSWIESVHSDDIERAQQNLQAYLAGEADKYMIELRLRCKDDSYKWILCRGTVVERDNIGKPVRMIGIHSDISRQKAVEKDLMEARSEAEYANRAKSTFLSSMSHELRTPMNAIIGFSQLLSMDEEQPLNVTQQDNVAEIKKAGSHLLELINDVLDLSRIEAGRIDLSIEAVSLGQVVAESIQLIHPLAQNRGIEISLQMDNDSIELEQLYDRQEAVRADYVRLKQVLLNMLSNAVKYNKENGQIVIACDQKNNDQMRISITDTGAGLNAEQISRLFQAFDRLNMGNSEIEGTGIGLVITKNIVELMGGTIGVDSLPGKGSTFWIELPNDTVVHLNQDEVADLHSQAKTDLNREHTMLYIEDNPANLRLVTKVFGGQPNIHMWSAHEPVLGIELAVENTPDLILLDINLPGMDGFEVLRHLRGQEATSSIPVIAISANAMPRDIERGMKAGFDDYITKPIDVTALLQTVTKRLNK